VNKTTSITAFGKTRISLLLVFTLAMATLQTIYGFEFTGERWRDNIRFYYMQDCPDYVLPSIEKAFESVSPISFENTGVRYSVAFDYKVTFYGADAPNKSLANIPSPVESEETDFAIDEPTIGATARRHQIQGSQKIIDFDV